MSEVSTILVVDDDQSIVELLRDFLVYENFHVITACTYRSSVGFVPPEFYFLHCS